MKITAIDPSKLKIESKVCVNKAHIVSHKDKSFYHVCKYDDGLVEMIPLQKYSHKTPTIERYYSHSLMRVSKAVALRYVSSGSLPSIAPSGDSSLR